MRSRSRQFLTCTLLATYAGIAFLGEGLHELMPDAGHHHHHGLSIVHCASDHGEHANDVGTSALASLTVNDGDSDSHLCEICEFLFQAVSQPAEVAAPIDWQPLVVAATPQPHPIHTPISLGPHAPRGPPLAA